MVAVGPGFCGCFSAAWVSFYIGDETLAWWDVTVIEIASVRSLPGPNMPQGVPIALSILSMEGSQVPRPLGLGWGHWGGAGDSGSSQVLPNPRHAWNPQGFYIPTVPKFCISKPPRELVKNAHSHPLTPESLIQLGLEVAQEPALNKQFRCF